MKRVIGYIRTSTAEQASEDRFGVEAQRNAIEKYAETHEMEIIGWKQDLGVSGSIDAEQDREGINEILYGEVSNPPVEGIVVYKLDRIARDMNLFFYIKMILYRKRIELFSATYETGMFGEYSGVIEAFLMFVAEQERKNIAMRTTQGRKIKARKGGYAGGWTPLGYTPVDGRWHIVEPEAKIVRFIFDAKDKGETLYNISKTLNNLGVTSKRGGKFTPTMVRNVLNNRKIYQGYYRYGDMAEWVVGDFQPILPDDGEK